jgi:hypothetical protein
MKPRPLRRLFRSLYRQRCPDDYITICLPREVVMREASASPDMASEDLETISKACIEAYNRFYS